MAAIFYRLAEKKCTRSYKYEPYKDTQESSEHEFCTCFVAYMPVLGTNNTNKEVLHSHLQTRYSSVHHGVELVPAPLEEGRQ